MQLSIIKPNNIKIDVFYAHILDKQQTIRIQDVLNIEITFNSASHILSSADNLCKQFGPRSGPTECWSQSGSKLFNTTILFLKEFFEKVNFENIQQTTTKFVVVC